MQGLSSRLSVQPRYQPAELGEPDDEADDAERREDAD